MKRLIVGSSALVVLAVSAAVYATVPGSDGQVHACYVPGGQLRIIDADAGISCRPGETNLEWPAVAPTAPTCPAGTTPLLGVCFETATRAGALWATAAHDCADEGRRLGTHTEVLAFHYSRQAQLVNVQEWTDHLFSSTDILFVLTLPGSLRLPPSTVFSSGSGANPLPYRCVVPL